MRGFPCFLIWHGSCNTIGSFFSISCKGRMFFPVPFSLMTVLRRGLLLAVLLPLAACSQEVSPWENMNYHAAIHANSDEGI